MKIATMMNAKTFRSSSGLTGAVTYYILERQNDDGGYTFCQFSESSAQDTYYALEILNALGITPRRPEMTAKFLQGLQNDNGSFDSVKVAYYVINALSMLGGFEPVRLGRDAMEFIRRVAEGIGAQDACVELISEIEAVYQAVNVLKTLNLPMDREKIVKHVLELRNDDGSFGRKRDSRIASTHYALMTLKALDQDLNEFLKTRDWIKSCEVPDGGFVGAPDLSPGYLLMEDIYFGVESLECLGAACSFPNEALRRIAWFQNRNGGFRRSELMSISEFESTYQALSCISSILREKNAVRM